MKILSIEPTPSPNTMKIILDQELPSGKSNNYKMENLDQAPTTIKSILGIEGIKGVYHVADFLAVERVAKYDWKQLLTQVRVLFGEDVTSEKTESVQLDDHFGEVQVSIQVFKQIPMQVKLTDGKEEKRVGLPKEFQTALAAIQKEDDNVVLQRKWKEYGVRYGDFDQIAKEVVDELIASFPSSKLEHIVKEDSLLQGSKQKRKYFKVTLESFDADDWQIRYQLLDQMVEPSIDDLPVLEKALQDEKTSIRRLAVVYLGMIEDKVVLPLLYNGLQDKMVSVRRTAGDCLSDLGFPEAQNAMIQSLKDKSKIVRWRAAMFLYEVGDEQCLTPLKEAENDPEFEVKMQIGMAIERIEGGQSAKGSVWKQMTEARK
jgi:hypothetical protein